MALTSPSDPAGSFFVVLFWFCCFLFFFYRCFSVRQLRRHPPPPAQPPRSAHRARRPPRSPRAAAPAGRRKAAGRLHLLRSHREPGFRVCPTPAEMEGTRAGSRRSPRAAAAGGLPAARPYRGAAVGAAAAAARLPPGQGPAELPGAAGLSLRRCLEEKPPLAAARPARDMPSVLKSLSISFASLFYLISNLFPTFPSLLS